MKTKEKTVIDIKTTSGCNREAILTIDKTKPAEMSVPNGTLSIPTAGADAELIMNSEEMIAIGEMLIEQGNLVKKLE